MKNEAKYLTYENWFYLLNTSFDSIYDSAEILQYYGAMLGKIYGESNRCISIL